MKQQTLKSICLSKDVPELFVDVQTQRVFPDSKMFADASPKMDLCSIREKYLKLKNEQDVDLVAFVERHFDLPLDHDMQLSTEKMDVWTYIDQLWLTLTRRPDFDNSSLLHLPRPYVVPGGRFREIYYWDSYFTMLGLAKSGHVDLVEDMVENFASLMRNYGVIPNGNREYYLSRTQPPYFALMLQLLAKLRKNERLLLGYIDVMEAEYAYWMKGQERLTHSGDAHSRVVKLKTFFLNRYHDDLNEPRPESFFEDKQLEKQLKANKVNLFRDIRSACESGWDFSSRWFADKQDFSSIETTRVIPVDLNCLMHELEATLARAYTLAGNDDQATRYQGFAEHRKQAIQELFFNPEQNWFCDLNREDASFRPTKTLAAAYPLYSELATAEQAAVIAEHLQSDFLYPGGWVTSTARSDQQWDFPNGWAPLQWTVYRGLRNYGFEDLARKGAEAWLKNVTALYSRTGRLYEKYDVVNTERFADGGEYQNQYGFGWTNAILLKLEEGLNEQSQ
ncbi:trehalase family glycosidase [Pseudoteredinibacter isoporae]|uniref:trehalase family glycosidase n=1 Tax=Pseudoteredinibacter isoporae TaxID=570281 RepID=UPI0031054815